MNRRDWLQNSLLVAGAGFLPSGAQAKNDPAELRVSSGLDILSGQEAVGADPREMHGYAMGLTAFQYGWPLVYMANLRWNWIINPEDQQVAVNQFIRPRKLIADSSYRAGGSMNTDTVYQCAFVDMSKGPVVLSAADPEGKYFSVQIVDLYTNTITYISKRAGGAIWGNFLIVPKGWKGKLPPGRGQFARTIEVDQPWIWVFVRLRIDQDNPAEIAWAMRKYDETKITPVADFLAGRAYTPSEHNVLDTSQFKGNPLSPYMTMNAMLAENPPNIAEHGILQGLKTINVGPGMDVSKNDEATNRGLMRAAKDGVRVLRSHVERPWSRSVNGWNYLPDGIGARYTDDYIMRGAWQSLWGIIAHPPHECTYLYATADQNGERLNAAGIYQLYMPRENFPDVEAFWSFTMYQDFNLVVNDSNRWAIRENMKGLKFDAQGGLRIYIQSERPGENNFGNWLPAPKSGNFNLVMRNYMPGKALIEKRYDPPVLRRVS